MLPHYRTHYLKTKTLITYGYSAPILLKLKAFLRPKSAKPAHTAN